MALQTSRWIASRIYNESSSPAAHRDVPAARSVTRFAAGLPGHFRAFKMHPGMGTGWKNARDVSMTFVTGLIADKRCAFHVRRHDYSSLNTGAGNQQRRPGRGPEQKQKKEATRFLPL